jgi:MFS family permease
MHQIVSAPVDSARRWWVLATVVAAQFMFGIDAFIVNVAIPTIAAELHASAAQIMPLAPRRHAAGYSRLDRAVSRIAVPDRSADVRP